MLETIQEYVPFKHSFIYFSSWIGSRYGSSKTTDEQLDEENNKGEIQGQDGTLSKNDIEDEADTVANTDEATGAGSSLPGMGLSLYSICTRSC